MRTSSLQTDTKKQTAAPSPGHDAEAPQTSPQGSLYRGGIDHSFGKMPVHSSTKPAFPASIIQPKLEINRPGDFYEQEADRMADKVMRMPDPHSVQRKCAHCEEEEEDKKHKVQRKESGPGQPQAGARTEAYISGLDGGGTPLLPQTKDFFESRFGSDFSGVRVHTDGAAARSARSLQALAYTAGNNIVFNSGQYAPDTAGGRKLLAHELTHVIQQKGAIRRKMIQRQSGGAGIDPTSSSSCRIHFVQGRTEFTDAREFAACMARIRSYLGGGGDRQVTLHGYASEEGAATNNLDLSRRRAQTVLSLLRAGRVDTSRVTIEAHGEDRSFPTLPENRRVEVLFTESIVMPPEDIRVPRPPVPPPTPTSPTTPAAPPMPPMLRFWLNAFIPTGLISSAFRASAGPFSGREVFPGPPHPGSFFPPSLHSNGCFETDDRAFSSALPAPSYRVHIMMEFDTATRSLRAISGVSGGFTFEIDCSSGAVLCTSTVAPTGFVGSLGVPLSSSQYIITFSGAAGDPCVALAPNLAARGEINIDLSARTYSYVAFTTIFPAMEMYFSTGSAPTTLFNMWPASSSPFSLVVPALRPHGGSGTF
ncbi:MAG: DUF4157 domain-containing protein [Williamsia sp.]|nr:DUF4157 domain-containing protein [Williamsia sp.]